ncbi:MAG: sigma-54 dependent transcriptional regulator [Candidatus Saganbacteria bacterium]|nr:sigma-54 dependent transcriptional regulator [Candidatus Saganbacteria bacterium]
MDTAQKTILVTDDEVSIRESFSLILGKDYNLLLAASGEAALKQLADQKIDLIFLDVRMPGMTGLEALERIRSIDKDVPVIMVTAVNDVSKAAEATKKGAQQYLIKPFNVNQILALVASTLRKRSLSKEARKIRQEAEEMHMLLDIVGQSDKILAVKESIEQAAGQDYPVFIIGAPGTEKEIAASLIHIKSSRSSFPLTSLNLGKGLNHYKAKQLFEGAKTGQSTFTLGKETGLLEKTNGGTLLLNNFENLPLSYQMELVKILKAKKTKDPETGLEFILDLRIIATSNYHPQELAQNNLLDVELFKELSQITIEIPNLRSRSTDIPILVTEWLEKINQKHSLGIKGFTKDALDTLSAYDWPGNLSQLVNILEKIALTTESELISVEEIPLDILLSSPIALSSKESEKLSQDAILGSFEKSYIENLLERTSGDKNATASLLGLTPNAFAIKTESLGIC